MIGKFSAVALVVFFAACSVPQRHSGKLQRPVSGASLPLVGDYTVSSERSELRVLVFRAGPLARLGHNHVMINHALTGHVRIGRSLAASEFTLSIPVNGFVVDDPQARSEEGADFSGEISESARAGTLHNMLGPALLNSIVYPTIEVRSERLQETSGSREATIRLQVAGHDIVLLAPFVVSSAADALMATAAFEIQQTQLGLTPFSLLGGALQVRDAIEIKLTIAAEWAPDH